jgi:hypothetical protein
MTTPSTINYDFAHSMSEAAKQRAVVILRSSLGGLEHIVGTVTYLEILKQARADIDTLIEQEEKAQQRECDAHDDGELYRHDMLSDARH